MSPARIWLLPLSLVACTLVVCSACTKDPADADEWHQVIRALEPLHQRLGEPKPGDWLATHKEPGQSYDEYRRTRPIRPIGKRNKIYIQPLGEMTAKQEEILRRTAEYMEVYFDTPVTIREPMLLTKIPEFAERAERGFGKQLRTSWVMRDVLAHNLPPDAAAYLALTTRDLWTGGPDSNFVFGQANLRARVAVWSMARNGDPEKDYTLCLRRSVKTATHETGHMFSMRHCIKWECNMCGSMTREESDRHSLALCPECVAKVSWACTAGPRARLKELAALCGKFGFKDEQAFYLKSVDALDPDRFR